MGIMCRCMYVVLHLVFLCFFFIKDQSKVTVLITKMTVLVFRKQRNHSRRIIY